MMPGMDAEMQEYDPTGAALLDIPDGASSAGDSGGGHTQTDMPTCAALAADAPPMPPNGGRPV